MRILFLGEPLANAEHWMNALRKVEGVEVLNWHLPQGGFLNRVFQWLLAVFRIKKVARQFNSDLIIGYRTTSYGFLAAVSGITPCIIAAQGETDVWPPNHWSAIFKRLLVKYAIKKADLVHAWGPHIATTLSGYGATKEQLLVLPRGVDTTLFSLPKEKTTGPVRLITTRGLYPEYHHELILNSLAKLKSEGYSFHYTIVGDGILKERLELISKNLKLEAEVHFVGRVNNDDLPAILQQSHIYIAMPETEGVSASLFEAMACGCFPIVTDLPANRLYIENGINGALIPVNSQNRLHKVLQDVMVNKEWRERVMAMNRKLVEEKADLDNNMNSFVDYYGKLIAGKCAE